MVLRNLTRVIIAAAILTGGVSLVEKTVKWHERKEAIRCAERYDIKTSEDNILHTLIINDRNLGATLYAEDVKPFGRFDKIFLTNVPKGHEFNYYNVEKLRKIYKYMN